MTSLCQLQNWMWQITTPSSTTPDVMTMWDMNAFWSAAFLAEGAIGRKSLRESAEYRTRFLRADNRWKHYERLQAEIFGHVIGVLPEFDLRLFQEPTGEDLRLIRSTGVEPKGKA